MRTGLYDMTVSHRRLFPQAHTLQTRVTSLLIDLDALLALDRACRFFSVGKANIASFHESDHGDGRRRGLRDWVRAQLMQAGVQPPDGKIFLLCMPRLLGRCFNPLSVYFCHARDGALSAMLYEVRNTFGQKHNYAFAVARDTSRLRHQVKKQFYVSPFLPMDMTYRFDVRRAPDSDPAGRLTIGILGEDTQRPLIRATMTGRRREITDRALLACALRLSFQGLRVLAEIHLEAIKLWWKGARFHSRPTPPAQSVTAGD